MNIPTLVLAALGFALAAGGIAAWFSRGRGQGTIDLLQTNIQAYKDAEKLKDEQITYLRGQLVIKDETIKRLINGTQTSID